MLWAVVHWVGENSFSAISENQVAEATVEEGETVSVTSKTSKGKSVIYKAVVEKVFGTKAQALVYEAGLIKNTQPELNSSDDQIDKNKNLPSRKRKPSQKKIDSTNLQDDNEDISSEEPQIKKGKENSKPKQKKLPKKKTNIDEDDSETESSQSKKSKESDRKLQQGVHQERIKGILNGRRSAGFIHLDTDDVVADIPPPPPLVQRRTSPFDAHQQQTKSLHSLDAQERQTGPGAPLHTVHIHDTHEQQTVNTVPLHTHPRTPLHTVPTCDAQEWQTPLHILDTYEQQTVPLHTGPRTPLHTGPRTPLHTVPTRDAHRQQTPLHTGTRTPLHTLDTHEQHTVPLHTGPRTPLHTVPTRDVQERRTPLHTGTRTPLRTLQPLAQKKTTEYMSLLEDDDSDLYGLQPLTQTFNPAQTRQECGEWESFTSHFTAQFEALKAEVDMLRNEVHRLKKAQKEAKEKKEKNSEQFEEGSMEQLMRMVENTTSPFDGLKTVLFSLFSEEDLRVSSLKGITTLAGGASTALNKEKLNNLYCLMERKYQTPKMDVDKWIRGQQRKLRDQYKKKLNK